MNFDEFFEDTEADEAVPDEPTVGMAVAEAEDSQDDCDSGGSDASSSEEDDSRFDDVYDPTCVKCSTNLIEYMAQPCRCIVLCKDCHSQRTMYRALQNCLLCTRKVSSYTKVAFSRTENNPNTPYTFACQVCYKERISMISTTCKQVIIGKRCAAQIRCADLLNRRSVKCPMCLTPCSFAAVTIRRRDNWICLLFLASKQ